MTNPIGNFIKSVFPSTVNKSGKVFTALLADGEGGGAIEAAFEDLEATRAAWQDALNAYSLLEEQNEKLFALISLLSQSDVSSESVYMERNKMLFDGARTARAPWGSVYDVKELFKEFFGIDEVWLINNCASIDESILTDGDFENEAAAWVLNGAEFYRYKAFSNNVSVLFEEGGTLSQAVAISDTGAYFLNFFLKGSVRVRVKNSAGLFWQPEENSTGEWVASDTYWEFASEEWDNKQLFFVLSDTDTVIIEFEALEADTFVDYTRLHLKTGSSMFTIIAGFEGGTSTDETASYAPAKDDFTEKEVAFTGTAVVGQHMTLYLQDINYDVMSYMESSYIFGSTGMKAQEVANTFLDIVKPAGVTAYIEILTAETEVSVAEEEEEESEEEKESEGEEESGNENIETN